MTSRERVRKAIHHEQPDRVPLDLGSTLVTGIQASAYARLKKALGISGEGTVFFHMPRLHLSVGKYLVIAEALQLPGAGLRDPASDRLGLFSCIFI